MPKNNNFVRVSENYLAMELNGHLIVQNKGSENPYVACVNCKAYICDMLDVQGKNIWPPINEHCKQEVS